MCLLFGNVPNLSSSKKREKSEYCIGYTQGECAACCRHHFGKMRDEKLNERFFLPMDERKNICRGSGKPYSLPLPPFLRRKHSLRKKQHWKEKTSREKCKHTGLYPTYRAENDPIVFSKEPHMLLIILDGLLHDLLNSSWSVFQDRLNFTPPNIFQTFLLHIIIARPWNSTEWCNQDLETVLSSCQPDLLKHSVASTSILLLPQALCCPLGSLSHFPVGLSDSPSLLVLVSSISAHFSLERFIQNAPGQTVVSKTEERMSLQQRELSVCISCSSCAQPQHAAGCSCGSCWQPAGMMLLLPLMPTFRHFKVVGVSTFPTAVFYIKH